MAKFLNFLGHCIEKTGNQVMAICETPIRSSLLILLGLFIGFVWWAI